MQCSCQDCKEPQLQPHAGAGQRTGAYLLEKAKLVVENDIEDAAIQIWSVGVDNERVSVGLIEARKGPRRMKLSRS
jgi:hypothetical protein